MSTNNCMWLFPGLQLCTRFDEMTRKSTPLIDESGTWVDPSTQCQELVGTHMDPSLAPIFTNETQGTKVDPCCWNPYIATDLCTSNMGHFLGFLRKQLLSLPSPMGLFLLFDKSMHTCSNESWYAHEMTRACWLFHW